MYLIDLMQASPISCALCNRVFQTLKGMKIHRSNHDLEASQRRKASISKFYNTSEGRKTQSKKGLIAWNDPVRRAVMLENIKIAINDPAVSHRKSKALKETNSRLEVKEKRSSSAKKARARQDVKEKHRQAALRPDVIERRSKAMKEALARESYKNKLSETLKKRHQTIKLYGGYGRLSSAIEDRFYDALCNHFGEKFIIRGVHVNRWLIDFYIVSIDAYIQFNGVYWHGLDRSRDMIECSEHPRDKVILSTIDRDAQRQKWFDENQLRLICVTDEQFKRMGTLLIETLGRQF